MIASDRFFVLSGGPGSGKTTLLEARASDGFDVMPEAGRMVMRMRRDAGEEPRGDDPVHFAELMLSVDLSNHRRAARLSGPVLFDRAIPDLVGYLRLMGQAVPGHLFEAARHHRYNRTVVIAPHWPAIYATDTERDQSAAEAMETCRCVAAAYRELGYEIAELPLVDVAKRADFVRAMIAGAAPPH